MIKEAKHLHSKAVDSLVLGVDHFNRAWDRARPEAVLIMLDRAFELLLKAIIVHRKGNIREVKKEGTTIGFDVCLRKCLTNDDLKCITEDEAVALQALNSMRDAAQHYMIEVSEEQLYVYAQAAVTLFSRMCAEVLHTPLKTSIPERIIPLCAKPPKDLGLLFDVEFKDIAAMVKPGSRQRLAAKARLRSMAVLQASLDGRKSQPSEGELDRIVTRINRGEDWREIFPGISTLTIDPGAGDGPSLSLRITKNQGEAIQLVKEGDPNAAVVAVKRVNELDYYSLFIRDIAKHVGKTTPKLLELVRIDKMQENIEFYKEIKIGAVVSKRYSEKALAHIKKRLEEVDLEQLWKQRK